MKATESNSNSIVDVAVGVVTRGDGRVLLAERPQGKPSAGYWEFPGGKFESNESPREALARELHEELGVELDAAYPWITRIHRYPHMTVRLHIYRVLRWHGEPHGRESQRLSWEDPHAVGVAPLLPANHDILQALALPRVYAITQASKYGIPGFMERLRPALESGVRLIQVREPAMSPPELAQFARQVVSLAHRYGAQVLVNGDETVARDAGADGVHLQAAQLMQRNSRPDTRLLAASCHNHEELQHAADLDVDFVVLSPVLPTQSHPGEPTLGWERFQELCLDMPMPVFALGGMRLDMLNTAMTHSAHGVSLLSGIWQTELTSEEKRTAPDALLLMATHCPYCPTVLQGLESLQAKGIIGTLEAINIEEHPEVAREAGVRTVPWVRIGPFELEGLRSEQELREWAEKAGTEAGLAAWLDQLLATGKVKTVEEQLKRDPAILAVLLSLFADTDTQMNTRIGISAIIEDLEGSDQLQGQVDRLAEMLSHPDAGIRGDACHFLSLTALPRAKELMVPLLDDPEQDVRMLAKDSIEQLEKTVLH